MAGNSDRQKNTGNPSAPAASARLSTSTPSNAPAPLNPSTEKYDTKRAIPAWALSLVMHTLIFVALILAYTTTQRGTDNTNDRSAGIVLVNADSETTEYLSEGDMADSEAANTEQQQNPSPLTADDQLPPELPGLESGVSELVGTGEDLAMALPGADSLIDGAPTTRDIGGKVTTEVFGVKGTGNKFVYVFDRSASMEGYEARPLIAARQQLLTSLESLGPNHQFQIIFYNDKTKIFNPGGGRPEIMFADDETKKKAEGFVNSIRGDRGTDHINALKEALGLTPDVIFLLTDAEGGFTEGELSDISRRNRGTVINAIEFGVGGKSGDRSIERLARESGGQYVYKNILTLKVNR